MQFISVIKAELSASLLQSKVSNDHSEIILICRFAAQETFIIINVESSCVQFLFRNRFLFLFYFFDE